MLAGRVAEYKWLLLRKGFACGRKIESSALHVSCQLRYWQYAGRKPTDKYGHVFARRSADPAAIKFKHYKRHHHANRRAAIHDYTALPPRTCKAGEKPA